MAFWRLAPWLARLMLAAPAALFLMIGWKYLSNPVAVAAGSGMALDTPAAVTDMRAYGATFLAVAVVILASLIDRRRLLLGFAFVAIVVGLVTAARLLGVFVDGAAAETRFKLVPELMLLTLAVAGLFLERARLKRAA